jgi:hypothetical protein
VAGTVGLMKEWFYEKIVSNSFSDHYCEQSQNNPCNFVGNQESHCDKGMVHITPQNPKDKTLKLIYCAIFHIIITIILPGIIVAMMFAC